MLIEKNEVHIWSATLIGTQEQENEKFNLLSQDEKKRAHQFRCSTHRQRFIFARATLRQIIGRYLNTAPEKILFAYTKYKKPYLHEAQQSQLQFNLAHSHDTAIFALTHKYFVGIDIERMRSHFNHAVTKRYFSPDENKELLSLPLKERNAASFRVWARKEALIKAAGKGLAISLSSFSVSAADIMEVISLENEEWSLLPLAIHTDYQAAVASNQTIRKLSYWKFFGQKPLMTNSTNIA